MYLILSLLSFSSEEVVDSNFSGIPLSKSKSTDKQAKHWMWTPEQKIENQKIENQKIENHKIENQKIENQKIENLKIENQ